MMKPHNTSRQVFCCIRDLGKSVEKKGKEARERESGLGEKEKRGEHEKGKPEGNGTAGGESRAKKGTEIVCMWLSLTWPAGPAH